MNDQIEKPAESLHEFLTREVESRVPAYKTLIRALRELDLEEVYQFRVGLERAAHDETAALRLKASQFWGQIEIDHAFRTYHGLSVVRRARADAADELNAERAAREAAKTAQVVQESRETYCWEHAAPNSTSIDVLEVGVRIHNCFKDLNMQTVGDVTRLTEEEWKEVPRFGRRSLYQLKEALTQVGRQIGDWL